MILRLSEIRGSPEAPSLASVTLREWDIFIVREIEDKEQQKEAIFSRVNIKRFCQAVSKPNLFRLFLFILS